MSHTIHHRTSMLSLEDQRAAAHAMPGGRARERRITELALAAITDAIGRRLPRARYVEFDWAPYGGLDAVAFLDHTGTEVTDEDLAGELTLWTSDLRSPALAGMTHTPGRPTPFRLDLHTTTADPERAHR